MPVHKSPQQQKLLLDTHVWIWLMEGEKKLTTAFQKAASFQSERGGLFVSAISVWEVGMLAQRKKLELEIDVMDWVERALEPSGVQLIPLTPEISIQSSRLPGEFHKDPADRLIVATAHLQHVLLVTHDQGILKYGKEQFVSVYDPL